LKETNEDSDDEEEDEDGKKKEEENKDDDKKEKKEVEIEKKKEIEEGEKKIEGKEGKAGKEGKEEKEVNKSQGDKPAADESKGDKLDEIDLKSISGNINYVNVDNLFYDENYDVKLSYTDYCCITEDFTTHNIGIELD
jgi:hypothetical protein